MANEPSGHIDTATLAQLEEHELADEMESWVLSHLQTCGRCQAERVLVHSYRSVPVAARLDGGHSDRLEASFRDRLSGRVSTEGRIRPSRRRSVGIRWSPFRLTRSGRDWMVGGLVAASLTLLCVGGYQMLQGPEPGELGAAFRSAKDVAGVLELRVEFLATGWEIRWPPVEGADTYHVRVLSARGGTLIERDVSEARTHIERSRLAGGEPSSIFLVQVEAIDASGRIARSEPTRLSDPAP